MDFSAILIQLVSGIVGGNAAGAASKSNTMGPVVNSILGAIGGIGGGQLAAPALGGGTGVEIGASAVIGALLPLIIGMFTKKKATV